MRFITASTLVPIMLIAVAAAVAQGPQGPAGPQAPRPQAKGGPGQPGPIQPGLVQPGVIQPAPRPGGPGPLWNDPQMAERLGINADQRKKIEAAMLEHRLHRIDLNAALQKAQVTLEPLVSAEPPNETLILAQMDRVAQAQAELQKDEMRLQLEIRKVLTPDQWRRMQTERPQGGQPGPAGPPPPSPQVQPRTN